MSINLRRIYDHSAPPDRWITLHEPCQTCQGKGKQLNQAGDAIIACPECENGQVIRRIPPVAGVEILQAGDIMHFSSRFVAGGQDEGWLKLIDSTLIIHGVNADAVYHVKRTPGRYDGERIHYYDCERVD